MPNLWTYEQKFNDLNDGNLEGQDGWFDNEPGNFTVLTTGSPYEGAKHIFSNDADRAIVMRAISGVVSGTVYFSVKWNTNGRGVLYLRGSNYDANRIGLTFNFVSGEIKLQGNVIKADAVANTYYRIGVAFECGAGGWEGLSADTVKANIDGGDWSAAYNFTAPDTNIQHICFDNYADTDGIYFDYISPEYAPPSVIKKHLFFNLF